MSNEGRVVWQEIPNRIACGNPEPLKLFQLWRWYSPEREWKLCGSTYYTRDSAEVSEKAAHPQGYTHTAIVEIRLPGGPT